MAFIDVEHVSKSFKIPKMQSGLAGAVKSLFHREYEIREAVKDVSFTIDAGEIVGYIGPNGAGKSTTIKMLSGVLQPDDGKITVDGLVPFEKRKDNARKIGVVFGQRSQLYWDLPVIDTFEIYQQLYSIPAETYTRNCAFFTELLEMKEFMHQPARQLSLGQKMKANLALAMLHDPKVLYLDEPTIGLDVMTKRRLRECIREINGHLGTTIILTTHDMDDIEEICKRIILIDKGEKLFDGTIRNFMEMHAQGAVYRLEFEKMPVWQARSGFACTVGDGHWILRTDANYSKDVLISLIEEYSPTNIVSERITIEDIVCQVFGRNVQ